MATNAATAHPGGGEEDGAAAAEGGHHDGCGVSAHAIRGRCSRVRGRNGEGGGGINNREGA